MEGHRMVVMLLSVILPNNRGLEDTASIETPGKTWFFS